MTEHLSQASGWEQPGSGFQWDPSGDTSLPPVNFDAPRPEYPGIPKYSRTMRDPSAGSAAGSFTRAAIPAALDAAALPVTLAGRAAEKLGYPNQAAHLRGSDALEAGEWLYRGVDPAQQRSEQEVERANYPASANFGEDVGTYAGGAKSGELAARGIGLAARGGVAAAKGLANEVAARGGAKAVAKNLWQDTAGHMKLGPGEVVAAEAEPAIPAWALQKPKAPEYRTPAAVRAKAVAAHKVIAEHPDAMALRGYMLSDYSALNRNLRKAAQGEEVFPQFEQQAQAIDRVLDSVKSAGLTHNGSTMRGLELPEGTVDKWIKSGAVQNKSFWSTTHNPDVADAFKGHAGYPGKEKVLLRLDQRSGVPVAGPEDEILIPRNKNWVVKDHEVLDDGTRVIELKEVPKLPPGVKPELSYDTSRLGAAASRAV